MKGPYRSGVGIVRGPGQRNVDFSLIKRFALSERTRLEFRAEAFNVLNHANFSNPVVSQTSPSFGQIPTTWVNPRMIQLALKLDF